MTPSKTRQILAWAFGLLIFGSLNFILEKFALDMGLATSFYFEGFQYGDYVETDKSTSIGWFLIVIEIIIASRIGMAIYHGSFTKGINNHTNLFLIILVGCIGVYALIDTVVWEVFEKELKRNVAPIIYNILNLCLLAIIGYAGFSSYHLIKDKREKARYFKKIFSDDGDHFLEEKDGVFFLGYDNGKDLRIWKFLLPDSLNKRELVQHFSQRTGMGIGRFEFFSWLEGEGVKLEEHHWY